MAATFCFDVCCVLVLLGILLEFSPLLSGALLVWVFWSLQAPFDYGPPLVTSLVASDGCSFYMGLHGDCVRA